MINDGRFYGRSLCYRDVSRESIPQEPVTHGAASYFASPWYLIIRPEIGAVFWGHSTLLVQNVPRTFFPGLVENYSFSLFQQNGRQAQENPS